MHLKRFATTIAAALSLASCEGSTSAPQGRELTAGARPVREVTATVRYIGLEGGFFALIGDDGVTYDPTRLDPAFARDGLRVRARLQVRDDLVGTHMVGPIVDVVEISRL